MTKIPSHSAWPKCVQSALKPGSPLEMSSGFAGGRVHPGSELQEGPKDENIHARSGAIRAFPGDAIIRPKNLGRGER